MRRHRSATKTRIRTPACSSGPVARMQVTPDGSPHRPHHPQPSDRLRQRRHRRDVPYTPHRTARLRLLSTRRKAAADRRLRQPERALPDRRRPRLLLHQRPTGTARHDGVQDVYEYTEGRPQLISAGLGAASWATPGSSGSRPPPAWSRRQRQRHRRLLRDPRQSRQPGPQRPSMKIYDARTGGGFAAEQPRPNAPRPTSAMARAAAVPAAPDRHQRQARQAGEARRRTEEAPQESTRRSTRRRPPSTTRATASRSESPPAAGREAIMVERLDHRRPLLPAILAVAPAAGADGRLHRRAPRCGRTCRCADQDLLRRTSFRAGGRPPRRDGRIRSRHAIRSDRPRLLLLQRDQRRTGRSPRRLHRQPPRDPRSAPRRSSRSTNARSTRRSGWRSPRGDQRTGAGPICRTRRSTTCAVAGTGRPARFQGLPLRLPHLHGDPAPAPAVTTD